MDDDFNTSLALAAMFDLVTYANKLIHSKDKFTQNEKETLTGIRRLLLELGSVFGLQLSKEVVGTRPDARQIKGMIAERDEARLNKDFKRADEIRRQLSDKGVILEDAKDGTRWRIKS